MKYSNIEEEAFIGILKNYINKEKSYVSSTTNKTKLKDLAKKHQLGGVIYYQTKDDSFVDDYLYAIYNYQQRKHETDSIFNLAKIPYTFFKGQSIAELYPIPALRTMGDIDVLVHPEDKSKFESILTDNGYSEKTERFHCEHVYIKSKLFIEVHDHLIYPKHGEQEEISFFENVWEYVSDNELDCNFHFVYLISHLAKHFKGDGVGIRQFMDLAVVIKEYELNWDWIIDSLKKINLYKFALLSFSFCKEWFGVSFPFDVTELNNDFFASSTTYILQNGVFGKENVENRANYSTFIYKEKGFFGIVCESISRVFPGYKTLSNSSNYRFVKDKPMLLPFAWALRIKNGLRNYQRSWSYVKKIYVPKKKIKGKEKFFNIWGLM